MKGEFKMNELPLSRYIKYKNRKIYSYDLNKYVTLTDLRRKVQDGCNIQVLTQDKKDITGKVLSQILSKLELTIDQKLLIIREN